MIPAGSRTAAAPLQPISERELLARIDERLPRYTSYPTAPHFSPQIGAPDYAGWLDSLAPRQTASLYLHVPFCEALCHYCGCHTTVTNRPDRIAHYASLLARETELVGEAIGRRQLVTHIHWGGGTPTALAASDFANVASALARQFRIAHDADIAVELDPRHLGQSHIDAFANAGVNRASLGVQDLDPGVQKAIGRIQSFDQTARAISRLRKIGVTHVNFDLMYGLPLQTEQSVAQSVATALTLRPSRVSLFGYAHVPWMKKHQELIPADRLPGPEQRLAQLRAASAILGEAGYVAVGLDHFAFPDDPLAVSMSQGRLRRNFQGYTTDRAPALIGLGASSIGCLPQGYVQNAAHLKMYRAQIERGQLATARGFRLSDQDRLRRTIIERLMCDLSVDLSAVTAAPFSDFAPEMGALAELSAYGLVVIDGTMISVPGAMRPFVRKVAACEASRPQTPSHANAFKKER